MPEFNTFDLGRAYVDAERVHSLRGETERRNQLLQMSQAEAAQAQQAKQELARLQENWAELQASKSNPEWRKRIADQVRAGAPQFANASDDELIAFAEAGLKQKLGIKDESGGAPTTRTIYRGDVAVQQEFDPITRAWADVGRGGRWQPKQTDSEGGRGKPPAGYRWKADGSSLEPIPGGPGDKPKNEQDSSFKAADTSALRGLVTTAFNGVYDPLSGNVTGIRKEDIGNLNKVTARASQIYKATPGISHAEAVEQALSELRSGGQNPAPRPGKSAPGKGKGKRVDVASQAEAEQALAEGRIEVGDLVYVNGQPAFRVEP